MKKLLILSLTLFVALGTFTSCSKKCKGGGWYGDRNLGYTPTEKPIDKATTATTTIALEEECEEIAD